MACWAVRTEFELTVLLHSRFGRILRSKEERKRHLIISADRENARRSVRGTP